MSGSLTHVQTQNQTYCDKIHGFTVPFTIFIPVLGQTHQQSQSVTVTNKIT